MTYDHINPIFRDRNKIQNRGTSTRTDLTLDELKNLLLCCNECNQLKSDYTIMMSKGRLNSLLKYKPTKESQYLTKTIVKNIKNACNILMKNEKI